MKILYAIFFTLLSLQTINAHPVFQKGMSYTSWGRDNLSQPASTESIADMRATGVEWVALTVFWFQESKTATEIAPDFYRYSASRESVEKAIADIHNQGLKVMLKPMVDIATGEWRANIVANEAWFQAYTEYIVDWATFADEHNVEMFCIGCEFVEAAKDNQWNNHWRDVIQQVREVYNGPLTYASNHGNERSIDWWDALDYIGIDAYYSLTDKNDPTYEEIENAWNFRANQIESWRNSAWPNKPIVFTEIGYRSFDGANDEPWDYSKDDPEKLDLQEQVDCYKAALTVLSQRDWFYGFYWWNWETRPDAGGLDNRGFTIQNKPAQDLLRDWYINKMQGGRYQTSAIPLHKSLR